MIRSVARSITTASQTLCKFPQVQRIPQVTAVRQSSTTGSEVKATPSSEVKLPPEQFEKSLWQETVQDMWWYKSNYEEFDHWEMRQIINHYATDDCIPSPETVIKILKGCRNLNDYALAVRFLEMVRLKNGKESVHEHWPWMMQQIGPAMEEMGITTLEEMGYDEPELWLEPVDDM